MKGMLTLSDGTRFLGESFGSPAGGSGEVVFNTGMMGYPESFTDPSYFGQILTLTYPLVGNYGVPEKRFLESQKIQVKGVIVQNYINNPSHFESKLTLSDWLKTEGVPALSGIDTRALTRKLRVHGVMLGKIVIPARFDARRAKAGIYKNGSPIRSGMTVPEKLFDPNKENILPLVSIKTPKTCGEGKKHIVLIDCGSKENIIKSLLKRKVKVSIVPWNFNPLKAPLPSSRGFDGVLISNGPGDPKMAKETIKTIKELLNKNIPTFGICLGSQLLSLAAGGDTYKLKFGHRGQNQPVQDVFTKKAIITSQNHGFAVDTKSLGKDWKEWFINLNDGTNEGIRHKTKPFLAVQFHPEASPGPLDAGYLFDEFLKYA